MTLAPAARKLVLALHLTSSLGWIGAVVAYVALGASAVATQDPQVVRGAWVALELTGWSVIVPMSLASLVTGIVISLGTPWGLFRHYWVVISLALTLFATVILVLHMPDVSAMAAMVRQADDASLAGGHGGDLFHAIGGLVVLLVITVLNIYKPQGLTSYGWRKQQETRTRLAGSDSVDGRTAAASIRLAASAHRPPADKELVR